MPHRPDGHPADWYPDPDDPSQVRFWDGDRWTGHVAQRSEVVTPDPVTGPPSPGPIRPGAPLGPADGRDPRPVPARTRLTAVALLTTPVLGYFLFFAGLFVPLGTVVFSAGAAWLAVRRAGPVLWTGRGWPHGRATAVAVGVAALWLPAVVNLAVNMLVHEAQLPVGLTSWLLFPMFGPEDFWTPGAVAVVVYALGAAASAVRRRPWPWVAGGLAAALAYDLTLGIAGIGFTS